MASRGRIDAYLDCNSPYSLFAYLWLRRNKQVLAEHDIDVELHPIFLGGINVGSGNKPPWTLPAKATYSRYDNPRAARLFGSQPLKAPPFFPIMTLLPMRCMLFVKDHYDTERYERQFGDLWTSYWSKHKDISKPDIMGECLRGNFNDEEVKSILAGGTDQRYKKLLTEETAKLVEKGAFGAPWMRVTNKKGVEEPFFGSDRFAQILQFLEVPFTDVTIKPAAKSRL